MWTDDDNDAEPLPEYYLTWAFCLGELQTVEIFLYWSN